MNFSHTIYEFIQNEKVKSTEIRYSNENFLCPFSEKFEYL